MKSLERELNESKQFPIFKRPFYRCNYCVLRVLQDHEMTSIAKGLIDMSPWTDLNYTTDTLINYLHSSDPSLYRFTIYVSEDIAGLVCVRFPLLRGAYIELLGIYQAYQAQGIGKEVIDWIETELCKVAYNNIWVLVSLFNQQAYHFYQRRNFTKIGQINDFIQSGDDEILLRKVVKKGYVAE